jgi:predicted RecB family nuclease
MRVNGVGEEYADLLEEAGVDTVKELATRNAENLAAAMEEKNAARKRVDRVPSATVVEKWVDEAKGLDPMVSH